LQVNRIDGDPWEIYETELAGFSGLGSFSELDKSFFKKLDEQLNKVNQFYQKKEKDFVAHADVLEKQMQALVEMSRVFSEQQRYQQVPAAASGSDDGKDGR
jgi:SPX domain protein involved in polyphosphate accumulation